MHLRTLNFDCGHVLKIRNTVVACIIHLVLTVTSLKYHFILTWTSLTGHLLFAFTCTLGLGLKTTLINRHMHMNTYTRAHIQSKVFGWMSNKWATTDSVCATWYSANKFSLGLVTHRRLSFVTQEKWLSP